MTAPDKPTWQTKLESAAMTPVTLPAFDARMTEALTQLQGKSSSEVSLEAERSKLAMEMMQARARAEQEFAIAERIRTAIEVEIEDYYDVSGSGNLGVDAESQSVGVRAGGQKVARRVVRLKGFSSEK